MHDLTVSQDQRHTVKGAGRRSTRRALSCPLFYTGIAFQGQGTLWNLSRQGCQIRGNVPMKKGTSLTLCLMHPDHPSPIFIDKAHVVWSKGRRFGLSLDVLYPAERQHLEDLLEGVPSMTAANGHLRALARKLGSVSKNSQHRPLT